jgi:transposase
MKKVFVVRLTDEERLELITLVRKGKTSAIVIARARILLKANQGKKGEAKTDAQVAEALSLSAKTVFNIRRRCVEEGLDAALRRKKQDRPSRFRKLDGDAEAKLVATCCGPAPKGQVRWTLRMLANKLVEMEVVDSISPETVRGTLKKMSLSLGSNNNGAFPKSTMRNSSGEWKMSLTFTAAPITPKFP